MKTLDRKAPMPLYYQLKEILSERLQETVPGDRLPTIRKLRKDFSINQATVERALMELEKDGLVRREHGRGIFVEDNENHKISTIGLLVRQKESFIWSDPFYLYAIKLFNCLSKGYNINLLAEKESPMPYIKMYRRKDVNGIILMDPKVDDEFLQCFQQENLPFVLIGTCAGTTGLQTIDVDSQAGAYMATDHLINRGHKNIGVITGPLDYTVSRLRLKGYKKALAANAIPLREELVRQGDYTGESGYRETTVLLESKERPTALLVTNGMMSLGALEAIREKEVAIPGDMAVVGYDDTLFSSVIYPKLTVVQQPLEELISRSFTLLTEQMRGERRVSAHILLKPILVQGDTT